MFISVDTETKEVLQRIEKATGANPAAIFRDALQVYLKWGLPHRPNAETAAILREAEQGQELVSHANLEDLFKHLDRLSDEADQNYPAL